MKAHEVLRLYEGGRRDFSGENLRGQSFQGEDLSRANFSETDIRSSNFTNAKLKGAIFTGAKAGLERHWVIALAIGSWLLSALSGFFSGFAGYLVGLIFDTSNTENVITGWVTLIALPIFFLITIRQGFVAVARAFAVTGAVVVAGVLAGVLAEAVAGVLAETRDIAEAFSVVTTGIVAVAAAGALAITATVTGAIAGALARAVAGT